MGDEQPVPDIVLVGHIVQEMIYFPDRTLGPVLGSPVAYGSIVAGRLGESVGIVTRVGTDMPRELLQPFAEANVDMAGLIVGQRDRTTTTELIYHPSGTKEIRYPRKADPITFADIPPHYRRARVIYVATMDHDVPLETLRELRSLDAALAIDLGGYGGAHSRVHPDESEQRNATVLPELAKCFDIVRASVEDCAHLFGKERVASEAGEAETVQRFITWGASVSLLTLGERGCIVATADRVVRIPAQPGNVVDTTGAGDSFSTAFLIGYMHTKDIEWSARFASAVVIYIIERTGGVHISRMPERADVEQRLAI